MRDDVLDLIQSPFVLPQHMPGVLGGVWQHGFRNTDRIGMHGCAAMRLVSRLGNAEAAQLAERVEIEIDQPHALRRAAR